MVGGKYQLARLFLPSQSTDPGVTMAIYFQAVDDSERVVTFNIETCSIFLFALSISSAGINHCFDSLIVWIILQVWKTPSRQNFCS